MAALRALPKSPQHVFTASDSGEPSRHATVTYRYMTVTSSQRPTRASQAATQPPRGRHMTAA